MEQAFLLTEYHWCVHYCGLIIYPWCNLVEKKNIFFNFRWEHFQIAEVCPCHQVNPRLPKRPPTHTPALPQGLLRFLIATYQFESYKTRGSRDKRGAVFTSRDLGVERVAFWVVTPWQKNVNVLKISSWIETPSKQHQMIMNNPTHKRWSNGALFSDATDPSLH